MDRGARQAGVCGDGRVRYNLAKKQPPKLSGFAKQTRRFLSKSNHFYIFLHFFYGQPHHLQIKTILFWKRYFRTYLAALDLLWWAGSLVVAYMLSCPASLIRDRTHVPCIGRWILNHWITWEFPKVTSLQASLVSISAPQHSNFSSEKLRN